MELEATKEEGRRNIYVYMGAQGVRTGQLYRMAYKVCRKTRMQKNRAERELVRLKHLLKF